MTNQQLTFEIIKLVVSFLTPLFIFIGGLSVVKQIEKNKLSALKEKEWQVKWADMFIKHVAEFSENVSNIAYNLAMRHTESQSKHEFYMDAKDRTKNIYTIYCNLLAIDWNLRIYSKFSPHNDEICAIQEKLIQYINALLFNRQSSLGTISDLQFEFNKIAKKVHNDILQADSKKQLHKS